MGIRQAVSDIGIGVIGSYVGTQVMERVSMIRWLGSNGAAGNRR